MSANQVTIYSNGIADFVRSYSVRQDNACHISIPVRRDHVADVLASLNVFGKVKLVSPPSFRPENEYESSFSIQPNSVFEGLARELSGAKVVLAYPGGNLTGTLVGIESEEEGTSGQKVVRKYFVILTSLGFQRCAFREVSSLQFEDETIQAEIEKSLQRNFQSIKPHSTFVELTVTTQEAETEAFLQYTLPAAAWKISYRLRQRDSGGYELLGFAVVDNNTDEDWNEMFISVVTGEPITFSTDLAESKIPRRKHVNVVQEAALGSVEVERGVQVFAGSAAMAMPDSRAARSMEDEEVFRQSATNRMESAEMSSAKTEEFGDFCSFRSESPVDIPANRSAVIPIFSQELSEIHTVLHFNQNNHSERPYRAMKFVNETSHSLGRGVCTVYEAGTYAGNCIMPATKPQEERLLPHALETGVRVWVRPQKRTQRRFGLKISNGMGYQSNAFRQEIHYHLQNSKEERFEVYLDHEFYLAHPEVQCSLWIGEQESQSLAPAETLTSGVRFTFSLEPQQSVICKVIETSVEESRVMLVKLSDHESINWRWIETEILDSNTALADDPQIQQCVEIHNTLDEKQQELQNMQALMKRLEGRQERLRKNIEVGGHNEQASKWRHDLAVIEERLTELESEQYPALVEEEHQIRRQLRETIVSLSASWSAEG